MGAPYSSTSVTGYNANPPPDDGTTVATNLITWAGIKNKLGDPLKTFATAIDSALLTAFGKTLSGATVVNTGVNYAAGAADQGRLIRTTVASVVITTPDATSVTAPFVFAVLNNSSGGMSVGGFGGTQTIDGQLSASLPAGTGVLLFTDGSNWYTAGQATATQPINFPQGRLTLVSGTPVMSADQTAATAVYYSPYVGNQCPIPNGTVFGQSTFSQLTLTINGTNYIANTIYDVFVFFDPADGATVKIGTGPAWNNSGAGTGSRGTGAGTTEIARLNGLWTNNNAITMRNNATTFSVATKSATYVGSIFIDGTNGQISCHFSYGQNRKFGLFNAYNRVPILLQMGDATTTWSYATATYRPSNNSTSNKVTTFCGLAEEQITAQFLQYMEMHSAGSSQSSNIGIGVNSTTAPSGTAGNSLINAASLDFRWNNQARYDLAPGLGINNLTSLESGNTNTSFNGGQALMLLTAAWRG